MPGVVAGIMKPDPSPGLVSPLPASSIAQENGTEAVVKRSIMSVNLIVSICIYKENVADFMGQDC